MMQQTQHGGTMTGIGSQQNQQTQQDQQQQQNQQQSQQQQQSQGQQTQQQQTQQPQTQQTQQSQQQQTQQTQQQAAQQQQQQQQQLQQQEVKLDSISRVKNHYGQMKDALMEALSCVATNVGNNNQVDQGNRNAGEIQHAKFEESIEKFYTLCDQMELNLRTAIDSQLQAKASQLNTPSSINTPPVEVQKYVHYLATVRNQVVFAKDIHTALVDAARMTTTSAMTTMDNAN